MGKFYLSLFFAKAVKFVLNITKLSNPIDFNINVSGKNHLVIEKNSSEWRTWYVLTEAGFYN